MSDSTALFATTMLAIATIAALAHGDIAATALCGVCAGFCGGLSWAGYCARRR